MPRTLAPDERWKRPLFWLLLTALFFVFVYEVRSVLLPFVLGMLSAYFLDPAADRMERAGVSRGMATLAITVIFFFILVAVVLLVTPLLAQQFGALIAAVPDYVDRLQAHYGAQLDAWMRQMDGNQGDAIRNALSKASDNLLQLSGAVLAGIFASGVALMNGVSLLLITPLVTFYLLRDWDKFTAHVDSLLPRAHADTIRAEFREIDETLAGFIRGQMNVCLILAVYYAAALSTVGLSFGLIIGIMSGLLVILPYVGFLFMFMIAMGVGFAQFGLTAPLGFLFGVYMLGQLIESYFLTPKLVGNRVGLHPLWIIFGMLAGGALFGFVGVLLSVPITAVAGVLIRFAMARYLESSLYRGD